MLFIARLPINRPTVFSVPFDAIVLKTVLKCFSSTNTWADEGTIQTELTRENSCFRGREQTRSKNSSRQRRYSSTNVGKTCEARVTANTHRAAYA